MALITLATGDTLVDVLDGSITLALRGPWVAHLATGADTAIAGRVRIQVQQGDDGFLAPFEGSVDDGEPYEGRHPLVIIGGAGGLSATAASTHYTAIPTRVPVQDLVRDVVRAAGEQLADGAYDALAGLSAARWSRAAGESWGRALDRIAKRFDLGWRVLDDGTVWVGVETWPEADLDGQILDLDSDARVLHVGFDIATARPGTTIAGRRISRVTFNGQGRAELKYEGP